MAIDLYVFALAQHFDTQAENRWQDCRVKLGGITAQTVGAVSQTSALGKKACVTENINIHIHT